MTYEDGEGSFKTVTDLHLAVVGTVRSFCLEKDEKAAAELFMCLMLTMMRNMFQSKPNIEANQRLIFFSTALLFGYYYAAAG